MKTKRCKMILAMCIFLAGTAFGLCAQKASVVYMEGVSNIRSASGKMRAVDFGGSLSFGESVITGKDGLVELKLQNGSTIKVTQNSVFGYSSTGTGANTRQVLATTAGTVSYKLNKAIGKSPLIQTNSMIAGVRGTEFTVFAARDGSVMLAVTGGIVDVESQGQMVSLYKDEAVEVAPCMPPGPKFAWLGKEKDFSSWNQGKMDTFFADPLKGLESAAGQLEESKVALEALKKPFEEATATWEKANKEYDKLVASGEKTAILAYQTEKLFPAQDARAVIILNIRFHALNYLSMRRYVLSNMYMEMKSRYPVNQPTEIQKYFTRHAEILARYETNIVPELNKNDY